MLPLSSDEQSRAYEERNEELFISLSHLTTVSVCLCVCSRWIPAREEGRVLCVPGNGRTGRCVAAEGV